MNTGRWLTRRLVLLALMAASLVAGVEAAEQAICHVCRVKAGEAEPEEAKAFRTHQGVRYGFCSEKCAQEFDADPVAYVPAILPRPAPAFRLTTLSGEQLDGQSLRGQVVLLDFWATWCVPCRKSMPALQGLHDRYAERGFRVVGVSIDEGGAAAVKKFVRSKKIHYPIAVDAKTAPAWEAFRVKAVPAAFLVDAQGRIVAQWSGAAADIDELEDKVKALLARTN
jgi:thiol-disulfide isomerase/thioredoxin